MSKQPEGKTAWLGTGELASLLGVTDETVRCWINRGVRPGNGSTVVRLQCARIGKRYFVRRKWLKEFMALLGAPARPVMPEKTEPEDKQAARFQREKEAAMKRLGRK